MKILREKDVVEMIGVSPVTLWRWQKAGIFPQRIKVGPNVIGWRSTVIEKFIESRQQPPEREAIYRTGDRS